MRGRGERMRKKAERRWTVMVVPHGSGSSRAVEVSQTFVKALVGIGSVVALTFLVLGVAAISRGVNITHSRAKWRRRPAPGRDRKSTRLNSSHLGISYAVFCLKNKILTYDANSGASRDF